MSNEKEEYEAASGYFQKPSFNARERLVCSHLIEGINASPLDTILHTTQAALLLDDIKLQDLEINKDRVLSLFTTAQRLSNPQILYVGVKGDKQSYSLMLRTDDIAYDIGPWFGNYRISAPPSEFEAFEENKENLEPRQYINWVTTHLSHEGYHSLVNDFLFFATPIIQDIGGKLASTVSPESYIELFRLIKGEKP